MRNVMRYLASLPRLLWWKIRFGKRLQAGWKQAFGGGATVHVARQAHLDLADGTVSRHALSLRVEGGRLKVGKGCFFNRNCSITCMESIEIGDGCSFGNNTVIVDHDHDYRGNSGSPFLAKPVTLGRQVWVGANCVILRGAQIDDGAVIGAGSVVKGHVGAHVLFYQERTDRTREIT